MNSTNDVHDLIRRLAEDHERITQLRGPELASIVTQILAQNAKAVEVIRQLSPRVDLLLSVQDQLQGTQRIAIECKAMRQLVEATAVEELKTVTEALHASRAIFVTTSTFTEQARRMAETVNSSMQLVDGLGFAGWIEAYQRQQTQFAASLAFRIQRLPLHEIGRVEHTESEDLESADLLERTVTAPYRDRFISVERLPWRLLQLILEDPRHMHRLTPREFEEFTAEILGALGFRDIILTPRAADGGRDVIASQEVNGIPLMFYFECKKYAEGHKVQLDTLRALLGVVAHNSTEANIGVLVTTSSFTAGAKKLILSECRLDGKDYDGIIGWVSGAKDRIREG